MTPEAKIAALTAELAETREATADMIVTVISATATTPEYREEVAQAYDGIAAGKMRSRVTAVLCRLVAERLRAG